MGGSDFEEEFRTCDVNYAPIATSLNCIAKKWSQPSSVVAMERNLIRSWYHGNTSYVTDAIGGRAEHLVIVVGASQTLKSTGMNFFREIAEEAERVRKSEV